MAPVGTGDPREKPLTLAARGSGVLCAGGRDHEKQYTNQNKRGLKETHVGIPQAKSYQPSAISGQLKPRPLSADYRLLTANLLALTAKKRYATGTPAVRT